MRKDIDAKKYEAYLEAEEELSEKYFVARLNEDFADCSL